MVKKSSKTEQVLKLITKDQDVLEGTKEREAERKTIHAEDEQNAPAFQQSHGTQARSTLVNITERLTLDHASEVMKRLNVCTCPVCTNDVIALALNSLPPKYVTTDAGKQYLLLDIYKKQYETDIISALTKACVRVKVSPRH